MISNVCQVSKTSSHAKDLRKSSDDIRHYLVKTNNRVLTEVPNGSSCANFIAILCHHFIAILSHHFQASILSQLALITLKKNSTYRHVLGPRVWGSSEAGVTRVTLQ